jgi:hypothetical protein
MAQLIDLSQVKAVLTSDDFAATLREVARCPVYGTADLPLDAHLLLSLNQTPNRLPFCSTPPARRVCRRGWR